MNVTWVTKRHYTHKDAFLERYGRVVELPAAWARMDVAASVELIDYRKGKAARALDGDLEIRTSPLRSAGALAGAWKRTRDRAPDVVVASGDCFVGLLGWRLARRTGARFVFDVYDDYRAFGAYRLFAGFRAYEFLLARAALVLYASKALAVQHPADTPWLLVPNGVDPAVFQPKPQADARAAIGLPDTGRWIGYFGGMETERGPDDLIDATGLLHADDPSIRLVLCGPQVPGRSFAVPWVDYRGPVPHAQIPDYINACDVVTLPYRRGPVIDMASSVKIAEYLYCHRPVVATRTPNLLENFPVQAAELGEAICNPGDAADMARAIDAQLRRPIVASMPREHTWQGIAERTLEALRTLT